MKSFVVFTIDVRFHEIARDDIMGIQRVHMITEDYIERAFGCTRDDMSAEPLPHSGVEPSDELAPVVGRIGNTTTFQPEGCLPTRAEWVLSPPGVLAGHRTRPERPPLSVCWVTRRACHS